MIGLQLRFWVVLIGLGTASGSAASPGVYLFTEADRYDPACPDRFPGAARLQLVDNGQNRPLVPGFAASAYASISFDGRRVLFAGRRKAGDSWQIWEVGLDGKSPRQITTFGEDAIAPLYLSAERIVYARRMPEGFQLETMPIKGGASLRLTYRPGDHVTSAVLRDGRILFEAPHPGSTSRDLYTVYADGSGVETYRCDHGRDRRAGAEVASGDIVFESGGRFARFTSSRAVQLDLPAVKGEFTGAVTEAADGNWLVAYRTDARLRYGIYQWDPRSAAPEKLWVGAADAVDPVIVRARGIPKRHPSALGKREGANLLCLNVYESKTRIAAGAAASVRVWTLDDVGSAVMLGQAPVESDGSFYVQAPSDRAIRFELLDRVGRIVAAEKGWFWARQGEQRVCVGCHAGPERAPENAAPATLLRSTEPARMMLPPRRSQ